MTVFCCAICPGFIVVRYHRFLLSDKLPSINGLNLHLGAQPSTGAWHVGDDDPRLEVLARKERTPHRSPGDLILSATVDCPAVDYPDEKVLAPHKVGGNP